MVVVGSESYVARGGLDGHGGAEVHVGTEYGHLMSRVIEDDGVVGEMEEFLMNQLPERPPRTITATATGRRAGGGGEFLRHAVGEEVTGGGTLEVQL